MSRQPMLRMVLLNDRARFWEGEGEAPAEPLAQRELGPPVIALGNLAGFVRVRAARQVERKHWRLATGRRLPARAGISLIEVLISIGVLTIGLLGIALMMPLAQHQVFQGVQEDRKAAAGKRAFREFKIRDMTNPNNWVGNIFDGVEGSATLRRAPYCLDPLGVVANLTDSTPDVSVFPSVRDTRVPRMIRISLAAAQPDFGSLALEHKKGIAKALGLALPPLAVPMTRLQAIEIFTAQDDLVFEVPDDELLPPQQILVNGKRYAEGRFTWFATVVPEPRTNSDLYRLSVVVTFQRVPDLDVAREQVATVQFFGATSAGFNVAYAGGDVELTSPNGTDPINSRTGDWVMLSQTVQNQANNGPSSQFDFRWYRIVAADRREGEAKREFTLQGPDWQILSPASATWATLVPGVVAVYEKTIRLATSSLWSSAPAL